MKINVENLFINIKIIFIIGPSGSVGPQGFQGKV